MNSIMKKRIKQTTKVTYKKRFFVFVALFAVAFCCAVFFGITALKYYNKSNNNASTIATLSSSINMYNGEIEKLNSEISKLNGDISNLNSANSDSSQLANNLQSTISKYENDIADYNKEIDRLNKELSQMGQATIPHTTKQTTTTTATTTPLPQTQPPADNGEKIAYLTFDDGPSVNTQKILDVLNEKQAKATFFVINTKHPELLPKIVESGNAIGLHTFSHSYSSVYASEEAYFADLEAISCLVKERTGVESKIIRFPGGSSNAVSKKYTPGIMTALTAKVQERGYAYFDWNVDSCDASKRTAPTQTIVDSVLNGTKGMNRICILMHDNVDKTTTVEALPQIIDGLRQQGYKFEVLTAETAPFHHGLNN